MDRSGRATRSVVESPGAPLAYGRCSTMIRRLFRCVAVVATVAGVIVSATPAEALPSPYLLVNVTTVSGGFRACAEGASAPWLALSRWDFVVAGTRSSTTQPTIFTSVTQT